MQHGHVAVALLGRQADHPRVIILQRHPAAHSRGKTCAKFKFANWREIQISGFPPLFTFFGGGSGRGQPAVVVHGGGGGAAGTAGAADSVGAISMKT